MDDETEEIKRHAARVIAYFKALVAQGMPRHEAMSLARSYSTDLIFAAFTKRAERLEKPEEDEPWRG